MTSKETLESLRLEACVSRAARVNYVRHLIPQNLRSRSRPVLVAAASLVALAVVHPVVHAQEKTILRRVEISGLESLSPDQVIARSGLRVGDSVDRPTIDAAAGTLMDSGWFKSVNYRVQITDSETTVVFEVAEKTPRSNPPVTSDILGNVTWSGNRALTNQQLANAFILLAGDAATRPRIDQGLDAVRKAYARNGYINAKITESNTRAAKHSVNYQFTISEGSQYRMGAVTLSGLNPADTRTLKSKWTLAAEAIYDDSYLDQYRATVIRPFVASLTQRTGARSKFEISTKPDTQKQTVDVMITFR
jgi:outer membrane protein assembly factor BamA